MEKEYVEALIKSLDKTYSTEEKFHLITVFLTELSNYQNKSTQAMEGVSETLIKVQKSFETLNDTNEKLFMRILDAEKRLSRLEFNYDLPKKGKQTQVEEVFKDLYKNQEEIMKIVQRNTKDHIKEIKDTTNLYKQITKLYNELETVHAKANKLIQRVESLESK